jgi:hypothetical protein
MRKLKAPKEESGLKYNRLTVVEFVGVDKHGKRKWLCECDCGSKIVVVLSEVKSGHTRSCGCLKNELTAERDRTRNLQNTGPKSTHWKGGRAVLGNGYIKIRKLGHSRADKSGYVYEHVLIMEQMLGRPVVHGEAVHHCNGEHADNRPFNLRLFASHGTHAAYHKKLKRDGISL